MDANIIQEIIKYRKEYKTGYKKIAKILNLSIIQVSDILIENGYIDHVIRLPKELEEELKYKYLNKNFSIKQLSKDYHISTQRIRSIFKILNLKINSMAYHSNYENKINHNYFSIIDNEHKAYWLGFLYADGYNSEKKYQIEITLKSKDKMVLEKLKKDTGAIYDIRPRKVKLNGKEYEACRLTMYSKQMSKDLAEKGCYQKKSLTLTFPNFKIVPNNLIHHFMRGYFDGDGCITGNNFSIVGTKEFINKFVEILRKNVDISKAEYYAETGKALEWHHASKKDCIKIYNYLYKDSTIYLERKRNKFLKLFDKTPAHEEIHDEQLL